jgi:SAM-dependent MidA family methyltransferase
MNFRDFMAFALYDEHHGYYATREDRIGRGGDFYTSSSVSAHFGQLLAAQAVRTWEFLGKPSELTVVECGAGTGHAADDLLAELETRFPQTFAATRYVISEISPALQKVQKNRLARFGDRVTWIQPEELAEKPVEGLVFSNELIDALPVHRVRVNGGRLQEWFVALSDTGQPVETWRETENAEFLTYMQKGELRLREGHEYEIGLDAVNWLETAARGLARGHLLTIDYGDQGDHLSEKPAGTVRGFLDHQVTTDFLANIGAQDLTADANFSALMNYGADFGLKTVRFQRQGDFLIGLGLLDRLQAMTSFENDSPQALKERLALKHFLVPGGFGDRFKALLQEKG